MAPTPTHIDGPESFEATFRVSRETNAKLGIYISELKRWQKAVNLVAPTTLDDIWHRHLADSAQIVDYIPASAVHLCDVGSGGGFPGLVVATLISGTADGRRDLAVTLVESDTRKAAFLREMARRMEIPVEILSTRIESDASVRRLNGVDTVTARAFAPLDRLFGLVAPVFSSKTVGVFLKGREVAREIEQAGRHWSFDVELHESITDSSGRIAVVRHLARKPEAKS